MRNLQAPEVLAGRNFQLLFAGQLLSGIGDGIALVAVAFAVLDATGSVASLGIVLAARYVPLAGFLLVGGVVADRFGRRQLMIMSDVIRAGSQGSFAVLLFSGHVQLWHCIALQGVFGAAEAFFRPALTGLVPQIVAGKHLQQANALNEVTFNASRILGPAFGGLVIIWSGSAGAIAADALTFLVSAALVLQLRVLRTTRAVPDEEPFVAQLVAGWREVRTRQWIWVSILNFTTLGTLTIPAILVLGPALSWRELAGVTGWAALTSAFGVGALAGSVVALHLEISRPGLVLGLTLTVAAIRPAFFVSGLGMPAIAALCFFAGAASSVASIVWVGLLQSHIPPAALSRVSAIDDFGSSLLTPVGFLIAAPLAASVGLEWGIVLLATLPVIVSLGTLAFADIRRLGWAPAAGESLQGDPAGEFTPPRQVSAPQVA